MEAYAEQDELIAFERSLTAAKALAARLAAPETADLTHAQVEAMIDDEGRAVLRQLFQDHTDLRADREQRAVGVVDADGVAHTRVEPDHARTLTTVFGSVTVTRMAYRAPGARNLYPADAVWNMPVGNASHGLRRLAAIESTRGSFDSAQAAIERAVGVRVGKRQIENAVVADATDIADFYAARRPNRVDDDRILVLTCDGKGVVMRPEALRAATAKAAATAEPRLATRVSPGEKTNRKRMAELVGVYDVKPVVREPGDVIARPGHDRNRDRSEGPKAAGKWLTGSLVDDAATVIAAGFDEAERRDPDHKRNWVALVDGNCHQIDVITAESAKRGVTVDIIVDFIHVMEYVWGAAWSFFDKADPAAEEWVADQLTKILDGKARQVAAGIRRRATTFGFKGKERAGADRCADYLVNKADHLHYERALAAGWPIATGIIEGACRYLVKDRLDITGARWGLAGAEAVLLLRALISNGDFDDYWTYHLQQEQQRHHHTRYQQHGSDYELAA